MSSEQNPTRQKILSATRFLLEQAAPNGVRMADIAKRAGISRQALYLHYPNRADLLIATTRFVDDEVGIDLLLAKSRAATSGRARLDAYVEAWGGYIPEIYAVARALMAMMESDEEARAAWHDRMNAVREGCAAAVSALDHDGDLRAGLDQKRGTDLLWSVLSVRMWEHLVRDCHWAQAEYLTEIKRLARAAVTAD